MSHEQFSTLANAARFYKQLGLNPIPLQPRSKKPVTAGWQGQIVPDEQIDAEFANGRNIGITLGPVPNTRVEGQAASGVYDLD